MCCTNLLPVIQAYTRDYGPLEKYRAVSGCAVLQGQVGQEETQREAKVFVWCILWRTSEIEELACMKSPVL